MIDPELRLNEKVDSMGKSPVSEWEARETRIEMERYKEKAKVETIEEEERPAPAPDDNVDPAAPKGGANKYNWKGNIFRIAMVIIVVAIVVASCFAIYQNWGSMEWADRIMGIANIAVQALSVVVDTVVLAADIGFTVAGSVMTVCAWAGPILAIVGLVLMIVTMIIQATRERQLTDSEKWMEEHGIPFVQNKLKDPPASRLSWVIAPAKLNPKSDSQTLTITGTNASNAAISIETVSTTITTGTSKSSLFANESFQEPSSTGGATGRFYLEASSTAIKDTLLFGHVEGSPSYGDSADANRNADKQTPWTLSIRALPTIDGKGKAELGKITLKPNDWVRIVLAGKTGEKYPNPFYIEVTENWGDGDSIAGGVANIDRSG